MAKKKITHEGEIVLGGNKIPCYVLDDGTRVLSARGMQDALKMVDEMESGKQKSGTRLTRYLAQKTLSHLYLRIKRLIIINRLIAIRAMRKSMDTRQHY